MALSRQYLLFVWLFCYNLEIPDLHCTTIFFFKLLTYIKMYRHQQSPPPPSSQTPPPHMPICNPFNILLLIRMASFSLYCHIRNWFIHEIDNHIVDLHL